MAVTGHESSDDLRLQLARKLYTAVVINASILKVKDVLKIVDIERIVNVLKKRGLWNGIRGFLQNYPCSFLVTEENGCAVIKPIVTIEFCRDFDGKRGCNRSFCYKLHVCRHFVKGKCTFGPRCKKPHHFQNESTREVLMKHFLDELSDEETREFLCRNVQHLLDPELANAELPKCLEICKYYNVATGCTRDFCPFIHVCRFFAEEGNCKFGSQCIRKHDINNVHSKILLHRYHMDHLNEPQVLAYLKIKGENRDHQPQQQQQQQQLSTNGIPIESMKDNNKNRGLSSSNSSLNGINASQFGSHFSLPNSIYGSLHSLMAEHNNSSRKLSQPSPGMNGNGGFSVLDSMSQTRKLSSSSMGRVYRPMSMEDNNMLLGSSVHSQNGDNGIHIGSNGFKVNSWSADVDVDFSSTTSPLMPTHNSFVNSSTSSSFLSEGNNSLANSMRYLGNDNTLLNNNNSVSHQITNGSDKFASKPVPTHSINGGAYISKSFNDSIVSSHLARDFHSFSLHDTHSNCNHSNGAPRDINNSSNNTRFSSSLGLGLHNLSLPNVHNASATTHQHTQHQQHRFQFTADNYHSDPEEKLSTSYTNSLRSQTSSLFTNNHNPILRTSSNDIISPTGSSSSINGGVGSTSTNNRSPVFDINDPFSEWNENGERMLRSFSGKEQEDDEYSLPYYRTRSLPNFETTSLYNNNNHNNSTYEKKLEKQTDEKSLSKSTSNECVCMTGEICLSNLNGGCKVANCKKQHTTEPFLWQIAAIPSSTTQLKNNINENGSLDSSSTTSAANLAWINVDENENIKLELAFCSVELEQSEIEVFGDSILVNFEEMTGEGRFDVTEHNNNNSSRNNCALTALLLQASGKSLICFILEYLFYIVL